MKIVIAGCGRTGATLARLLSAEGHDIFVIDQQRDSFRRFGRTPPSNIRTVTGNVLDEDALQEANVSRADAFFACTQGDNTNIMAMQIARDRFGIQRVGGKINDPIRGEEYRKLGFFTISECLILGGVFADWLHEREMRPVEDYIHASTGK